LERRRDLNRSREKVTKPAVLEKRKNEA
jgi:hypothetical protein